MKVLILAGNGMLGHKLAMTFQGRAELYVTYRDNPIRYPGYNLNEKNIIRGVDVLDLDRVEAVIDWIKPDVIVNAAGVIKQRQAEDTIFFAVNSFFPKSLGRICDQRDIRLIHISSDCVFSGKAGGYREDDDTDPNEVYGASKMLGEELGSRSLVLRTSLIGWQLRDFNGLLSWFIKNKNEQSIAGYTHAIFSGVTTSVFSDLILEIIQDHAQISGVYHVASRPISKFDLLGGMRDRLHLPMLIRQDMSLICDRSLCGDKLRGAIGWSAPAWDLMLDSIVGEWPSYMPFYYGVS